MSKYTLNIYLVLAISNFFIFQIKCQDNLICEGIYPKDVTDCLKYSNMWAKCCLIHKNNDKKCKKIYEEKATWKEKNDTIWNVVCEKSNTKSNCESITPLDRYGCYKNSLVNNTCCYSKYEKNNTSVAKCFFYGEKIKNLSLNSAGIEVYCNSIYNNYKVEIYWIFINILIFQNLFF